ncbi:MAG: hypothetical protein JST36_07610 [Bacteroidetes bacterium]|nr:hypothetical protein [Bacteroidota bacterium]
MTAKYQISDWVVVDGTATGYGDLVGWIQAIELSEILGQPYYQVRVYSMYTSSVFVAEKFLSPSTPQTF